MTGHLVIANIGGQVRQLLVTAWNPYTKAVKVAWPPQSAAVGSRHRFSNFGQTEIDEAHYEPLDPDGFRSDTHG
jgi:hypothetical protein